MVGNWDAAHFTAAGNANGALRAELDSDHPYTLARISGSPGSTSSSGALVKTVGLADMNIELSDQTREAWLQTTWTITGGDGSSDAAVIIGSDG